MNYYDAHFQDYIQSTLDLDMSELYREFKLPPSARVLDIGCGTGRDLKFFKNQGHQCLGLEPSPKLSVFASEYADCVVLEFGINDFKTQEKFDGIWACASLLHLTNDELKEAFSHIKNLMNDNAVFYCSFKLGDFKGERDGRYYNDQTLESVSRLIPFELVISKSWTTIDVRVDRCQQWLNLILYHFEKQDL